MPPGHPGKDIGKGDEYQAGTRVRVYAKGKAGGKIDAVTGGTQTSTRLERFLNAQLAAWRERMEGGDR